MALDPSIPLSVRQQPGLNPLAIMSAMSQMREQEQAAAEAAAEREERKQAKLSAQQEAALKAVARAMLPIKGIPPEQRAEPFTRAVRSLKAGGLIPADFDEVYTPGDDDQWLDSMPSVLMTDAQRVEPYLPQKSAPPQGLMELPDGTVFDPNTRMDVRKGTPPEKPRRLMHLGGNRVLDQDTGKLVELPDLPADEAKPDTRSLDLQAADALAKGDIATYQRLLKVKKEMGQADDRALASGGGSQYFTPLQTAQGVVAFDNRTGKVVGRVADLKPGETAQREIANAQTVLTMMQAITTGLTPEKIGPIAGRFKTVEAAVTGGDPTFATLAAQTAQLQNVVINLRTGAAMSEPEAARIIAELPTVNLPPNTYVARLKNAQKYYEDWLKNRSTLAFGRTTEQGVTGMSTGAQPPPPTSGGGALTYQDYLNRQRK